MPAPRKFTDTHKFCYKCGLDKELPMFSKDKTRAGGLSGICRDCRTSKYRQDKSRIKTVSDAWYRSNAERKKKTSQEWRIANQDRMRFLVSAWSSTNQAKRNMNSAKYRKAVRRATPPWLTDADIQWILWYYKQAKYIEKSTGIPHSVDHIMPLQGKEVWGLHVPWNLQVIPAVENSRKGNRIYV